MPNEIQIGDSRKTAIIAVGYGLVCHALFVVGVGAMIYETFFGMTRSLGSLHGLSRLFVNGMLLAQFPILHSLLLTRYGRASMGHLAPTRLAARLSTTIYATIASVQASLLFILWSPSGVIWWKAEGTTLVVVTCLDTTAWLLLLKAIVDAGFGMQVGLLGWWAVARGRMPVYPPMPLPSTYLRSVRHDALDRVEAHAGPDGHIRNSDFLLHCGSAVQGSAVSARIRPPVCGLPASRPLLVAVDAIESRT